MMFPRSEIPRSTCAVVSTVAKVGFSWETREGQTELWRLLRNAMRCHIDALGCHPFIIEFVE